MPAVTPRRGRGTPTRVAGAGVSAIAAVTAAGGAAWLARRALVRRYGVPPYRRGTELPPGDGIGTAELPGPGGATLRALLLRTPGAVGSALVLHGWGGSALDMLPVGELLREEGLDVVLLDARAHGRSDDVTLTSMPAFADDLSAAIAWWRTASGLADGRLVLVGHSVGAGACLLAAREEPAVDAVVVLASMADPRRVMQRVLVGAGLPPPLTGLPLRLIEHLVGRRFTSFAPLAVIQALDLPLVIVHGQDDATIPVEDARQLARAAPQAELVVVPGAGHSDAAVVSALRLPLRRLLERLAAREEGSGHDT